MKQAVLFLFGGLLILTTSCRKSNFIGEELLPEEDFLNSERVDTFRIVTYTDLSDSLVTSQNIFYALGSINSDTYGHASAGIYTQVKLPTNNLYFGESPVLDSVVITLDYSGYYGDTNALHTVNVYRLYDKMQSGRLYFSDTRFRSLPVPIGRKANFKADLRDSIMLADSSVYDPHLRITLFNGIGQSIIGLDSTVLENDTTFSNFLQGIYITPDTTAGFSNGVMYFDMNSALSGFRVYYHNSEADSLSTVFPFTGVKTNYFTHSYPTTSPVFSALTAPDTTYGDLVSYVQGFGGLRTIVKLPTIKNLQDVSINKAELTLTATVSDGRSFAPPPKIQLFQLDSLQHNFYYFALYSIETYSTIMDDNYGTKDVGGTVVRGVSETGRIIYQYKYIITQQLQEIIEGSIENNGFALVCQPGNRIPNAVTLGGSGAFRSTFKPYLSITYTTVNK